MFATLRSFIADSKVRSLFDQWSGWAVVALAAVLRFVNLGYPGKLVFDETYYVKDALTLSVNGYERNWAADNAAFEAGDVMGFADTPAFVVHPPLGKWIIAAGMWLTGPNNSFSWRFSVALLGVAAVGLLILVARKLFKSTVWAALAGFMFAIDGEAIVLSRTALLDNILMFFVLLGFWFLLKDRDAFAAGTAHGWRRPWLLAVGISLGAASAVKWSGLYFLAFFAVYTVVSEALARRGEFKPVFEILEALRKFVILIPTAVVVYISTWSGWLLTAGGYDRQWSEDAANRWTGLLAWVPTQLQSLWHYHVEAYNFHVNLQTPHSYSANPLTWLFLIRPTSFFYEGRANGEDGCVDLSGCSSAITALGNPFIWLAAVAAAFYLLLHLLRAIKNRSTDSTAALILLGIAAGYLPWMLYLRRTVFQFYVIAFEPFMILALVYAAALLWRSASEERREQLFKIGGGYLIATSVFSAFFLPIWFGTWVPYWYWLIHMWIPSWI